MWVELELTEGGEVKRQHGELEYNNDKNRSYFAFLNLHVISLRFIQGEDEIRSPILSAFRLDAAEM